MANPFKPTAGATPPMLVGRQPILDEFQESIEDGPGALGCSSCWPVLEGSVKPSCSRNSAMWR